MWNPGFGWGFGHGLFSLLGNIVAGLAFILCVSVTIAVLFLLVRFLLVATRAAQLYVDKNGVDKSVVAENDPTPPATASQAADTDPAPAETASTDAGSAWTASTSPTALTPASATPAPKSAAKAAAAKPTSATKPISATKPGRSPRQPPRMGA